MSYFKIVDKELPNGDLKFGILNTKTNDLVLEYNYYRIEYGNLMNHYDLSMTNKEEMYSFYESVEDSNNEKISFGFVKNENFIISKKKYSRLKFFYKNLAIIEVDENLHSIIDINENILEGPNDFYLYERDFSNNDIDELIRFHQQSQDTIDDYTTGIDYVNYGYGIVNDLIDLFDDGTVIVDELHIDYRHVLPIEGKLGFKFNSNALNNYYTYQSLLFDKIELFDYSTGVCIIKDQNKYTFMNRYLMPIGDWSDESPTLCNNFNNEFTYLIFKDKAFHEVKLVGNFVNEFLNAPHLFFEYQFIKDFYNNKFNINTDFNEIPNRVYFKMDKLYLEILILEAKKENSNFIATDEWIDKTIKSDLFLESLEKYIPLILSEELKMDKSKLTELIKEHNKIFGLIPSSYEFINE
jgi:hypothetical protein